MTGRRQAPRGRRRAAPLEPLLAQHRQHLAQLRSRLIVPAGSPGHGRAASQPPVPGCPVRASAAVLAALDAAEQAAGTLLATGCRERCPSLAQLLASIAASEATHAALLRSRRGTG